MSRLLLSICASIVLPAGCVQQQVKQDLVSQSSVLRASIVHILSETKDGQSFATGWLLDDGYTVITARHVLREEDGSAVNISKVFIVFADGTAITPNKSAWSKKDDVGIYKLAPDWKRAGKKGLSLGGKNPAVGEQLSFMGWPEEDDDPVFVTGVVGAYTESERLTMWRMLLLATVLPGDSGSPVINNDHKVVGMVVAGRRSAFTYTYCVPLDTLLHDIPLLQDEVK